MKDTNKNIIAVGLMNNIAQINSEFSIQKNNKNKIQLTKKKTLKNTFQLIFSKNAYNEYQSLKKLNFILNQDSINPRKFILQTVLNNFKYYDSEDYICKMYSNLLNKEFDKKTQHLVLPSYINIIKELSLEDYMFLDKIKNCSKSKLSILYVKVKNKEEDETDLFLDGYILDTIVIDNSYVPHKYKTIKINSISLDNLERLKIIATSNIFQQPNNINAVNEEVKNIESIKNNYNIDSDCELCYEHNMLTITDFGKQFIDVCCS